MGQWAVRSSSFNIKRGHLDVSYAFQQLGCQSNIWVAWKSAVSHVGQIIAGQLVDRTYTGLRSQSGRKIYGDEINGYVWIEALPVDADHDFQWCFDRLKFKTNVWEHYDPPSLPSGTSWANQGPWFIDGYIYVTQIALNLYGAGRWKRVWRRSMDAPVTDPWTMLFEGGHGFYADGCCSMGATKAGNYIGVGRREQGPVDDVLISTGGLAWSESPPNASYFILNSDMLPVELGTGELVFTAINTTDQGLNVSADGITWRQIVPNTPLRAQTWVQQLATDGQKLLYTEIDTGGGQVILGSTDSDWVDHSPIVAAGSVAYFDNCSGLWWIGSVDAIRGWDRALAGSIPVYNASALAITGGEIHPASMTAIDGTGDWPVTA